MSLRARSIAVYAPNWIGDAVMATPLLRCLRESFASSRLSVLAIPRVAPVFRGCPWVDETLEIQPGHGLCPLDLLNAVRAVRARRLELGLILPQSCRAALVGYLGGIRRRIGYRRDVQAILLSESIPRPAEGGHFRPTYMGDFYLALAEHLGLEPRDRRTELWVDEATDRAAAAILASRGIDPDSGYVLLCPGASFGPAKLWPSAHFGRLADLLSEATGRPMAVICGPADKIHADAIVWDAEVPVVNLSEAGIDLHLLKAAVARCGLMVTTDSGPRHYGVALGRPTVCVMGPTDPRYSTSGRVNDRIVRVDVPCGPCQKKTCPLDHRCMKEIPAEMVLGACLELLSADEGQAS
jgi:heptosyltransferase-2